MSMSSSPNFNYGFPTPGPQNPTAQKVMNNVFFLSNTEWKHVREEESFDYIIIGSGPCALGFVERTYKNNPHAKILIIERGSFFLPEHFQNLPLPYKNTLGGLAETFPWTLSDKTHNGAFIKWQHGMVPFFGGRSIMWSAWCPRPTEEEMQGWPEEVIKTAQKYFAEAEKLLNVIPANKIDEGRKKPIFNDRPIFGVLQNNLYSMLHDNLQKIDSATRVINAPLAVDAPNEPDIDFQKFSVPGPLLALVEQQKDLAAANKGSPLRIVAECTVNRIVQQDNKATALDTTRGVVNVGDAQIILAMGTLPPTTLTLNSFPSVKNAGKRFTAHFISAIIARVPRVDYSFHNDLLDLELAAIYLAGINKETQGQYHIQLTALSDKNPVKNAKSAERHMPDVVATASMEQLLSSKDHVVFVCAVLGELDYDNKNNWLCKNNGDDPTTNVTLQVLENENDSKTWDTMDEGTFQTLEKILSPKGDSGLEYWHSNPDGTGSWKSQRPTTEQFRVPGLVHEGSSLWIGDDDAPVNLDYKLNGVANVYVTGGCLWPRAGSWNPTMTMVGLSQHLADTLTKK